MMICVNCGIEFDEDKFEICPFCLEPVGKNNFEKIDSAVRINKELVCMEKNQELETECIEPDEEGFEQIGEDLMDSEKDVVIEETSEKSDEISKPVGIPNIELQKIDSLSVRTKNVLGRNNIFTFVSLLEFLKNNKVTDLNGAGVTVEEEIACLISRVLAGEFNDAYTDISESIEIDMPIERKVKKLIELGTVENIEIDCIYDISKRTYNILKSHCINTVLELVNFLSENSIRDVRGAGVTVQNEIPVILNNFLEGFYKNVFVEGNVEKRLEEQLIEEINSRGYNIVLRRAKGDTLQEIGNSGDEIITRERVRQIERKFIRKYCEPLGVIVDELRGNRNFLYAQEVRDIYGDEELGNVLVYVLKQNQKYEYLDFADCFVVLEIDKSVEDKINKLMVEFVGEGIDIYENIELLDELFESNDISFMGLGEVFNFLEKYNYKIYGDYVTQHRVSYAVLCKNIVREYFPNGIKLNQDEDAVCDDLVKFRKLFREKYTDVLLPESDRALSARMSSVMVICDRGKILPEENVQIELELLNEIKNYIDNLQIEKIYYSEVFANFEGRLRLTSNIDNYYFLHGIMMLYFPDDYEYYRDYMIRKDFEGTPENNADRVRKFIIQKGRTVSRYELRAQFPGFSNIMIDLMFDEDPMLMQWDYNTYTCKDLIKATIEDRNNIIKILEKSLEENRGVLSENKLFDIINREYPDFITKNEMFMPINLYYYCAKTFDEVADFRMPNISRKGMFDTLSIKDISLYLLGNPEKILYSDYLKIAKRMMWTDVSASNAFYRIENDYIRISDDAYVKKNKLDIDSSLLPEIRGIIEKLFEDEYLAICNIDDYEQFPNIGYDWNGYLLESIIKNYFKDIKLIIPEYKDRRYQKTIILSDKIDVNSYPELVAYVVKKAGYKSMNEGAFLSLLVINGLAYKVIPKEIGNSKYFTVEKEIYILNEVY